MSYQNIIYIVLMYLDVILMKKKNNDIFKFKECFTNGQLRKIILKYRKLNPKTRFILQCILVKNYIDSVGKIDDCFKDYIDDFIFRQQMTVDNYFDK